MQTILRWHTPVYAAEQAMIFVYLVNGQTVELLGAVKVSAASFPGSQQTDAIDCLDGADKQIGCFRTEQVAGYSIKPDITDGIATAATTEAIGLPTLSEEPEPQ